MVSGAILEKDLNRLRAALKAQDLFRLIFVGCDSPQLKDAFWETPKEVFSDRKLEFFSVEKLTYRQIVDGLLEIEEGIVFIPDFEYILYRHDI